MSFFRLFSKLFLNKCPLIGVLTLLNFRFLQLSYFSKNLPVKIKTEVILKLELIKVNDRLIPVKILPVSLKQSVHASNRDSFESMVQCVRSDQNYKWQTTRPVSFSLFLSLSSKDNKTIALCKTIKQY